MAAFKELVFSGVQPTGNLHLGNYLGAIRRFVEMQSREAQCLYCVVDLHAITVWQDPEALRGQIREVSAAFLAAGIDPKRSIVFNQSQVPQHAELAWIFNCVARLGWLNRMTQFKEKAGKDRENASIGLYDYPVLMAADILAYRATHVPVGEDQKQHLELTRDIAQKFNTDFGASIAAQGHGDGFFPVTEPIIGGPAARVMSLRDGTKKMSKSDPSDNSRINLTDDADAIAQKIRRAKTDPEPLPSEITGLKERPKRTTSSASTPRSRTAPARTCSSSSAGTVLDLQAGACRPRRVEPRAHRRRDAPALRRPRPYRRRSRRRRRTGGGDRSLSRPSTRRRTSSASSGGPPMTVRALVFDVFGTLVDWRSGVAGEVQRLLALTRKASTGAPSPMRAGALPALDGDGALGRPRLCRSRHAPHRIPAGVLAQFGVAGVPADVQAELVQAWHRLDAWPEVPAALARLRAQFMLAPNSNGPLRLMVDLARRNGFVFDAVLGAGYSRDYKPKPALYRDASRPSASRRVRR